jgi:hypothetical protein
MSWNAFDRHCWSETQVVAHVFFLQPPVSSLPPHHGIHALQGVAACCRSDFAHADHK